MFMNEDRKSFEQLIAEKAGCFEFAWNGFIRLYEKDEKLCECKDCKAMADLNNQFNSFVKPWNETEEGKRQLIDIINKKFKFHKDGSIHER